LAVVTLPCARDSGLAHIFAGYASKHIVRNGLIFYILISFSAMVYYQPVMGVILLGFVTVSYLWFSAMVKKQFGGITGDLAGFWLVLCETGIVTLVAVMGGIVQ
jgi:adenosylcobinamide-GDP ribazoletransferase